VDELDARQSFRTNADVPGRETDFDAVGYAAFAINVTVPEPNSGYVLRHARHAAHQNSFRVSQSPRSPEFEWLLS
jgi:hypothetical protein